MASGSGVRAVCGALITVIGVDLGISGAAADDLVGRSAPAMLVIRPV
jgi:hypothetical protein